MFMTDTVPKHVYFDLFKAIQFIRSDYFVTIKNSSLNRDVSLFCCNTSMRRDITVLATFNADYVSSVTREAPTLT